MHSASSPSRFKMVRFRCVKMVPEQDSEATRELFGGSNAGHQPVIIEAEPRSPTESAVHLFIKQYHCLASSTAEVLHSINC